VSRFYHARAGMMVAAACGDGAAADAGDIIAIGSGDALDQAESAQARELAGDGGGGEGVEHWKEMGTADTSDVEARPLEGRAADAVRWG
jgi:hypothetical protein